MSTFITGGTGYLGGYVVDRLLRESRSEQLIVLTRAGSQQQAREKLWRALQSHRSEEEFWNDLRRVELVRGDLHAPMFGLEEPSRVAEKVTSIIHIAASLNRKSERACLNTNLRGGLHTIRFAQEALSRGGLKRFSHVSTVAVAGERHHETVFEDQAIDWNRRDYDPYARTKKFCEYMVDELLGDVPTTFLRPSIVLGDSETHQTTQFDMIRAVSVIAELPFIPLDPAWRLDIVPANYVADAIVHIHRQASPAHAIYHLSSGTDAPTVREIGDALESGFSKRRYRYAPRLESTFRLGFDAMNTSPKKLGLRGVGALMKVFWPYVTFNTVFDNQRVVEALAGRKPTRFDHYAAPLLRFAKENGFSYPYRALKQRNPERQAFTTTRP